MYSIYWSNAITKQKEENPCVSMHSPRIYYSIGLYHLVKGIKCSKNIFVERVNPKRPGLNGLCLNKFSNHLSKAQLRAPLSPSKQSGPLSTLTYIAAGHPQQALLWWERDIVTDIMSVTPLESGWCAVHSTPSRLLWARSVPCGWAYRPVRIDCQDTMP